MQRLCGSPARRCRASPEPGRAARARPHRVHQRRAARARGSRSPRRSRPGRARHRYAGSAPPAGCTAPRNLSARRSSWSWSGSLRRRCDANTIQILDGIRGNLLTAFMVVASVNRHSQIARRPSGGERGHRARRSVTALDAERDHEDALATVALRRWAA